MRKALCLQLDPNPNASHVTYYILDRVTYQTLWHCGHGAHREFTVTQRSLCIKSSVMWYIRIMAQRAHCTTGLWPCGTQGVLHKGRTSSEKWGSLLLMGLLLGIPLYDYLEYGTVRNGHGTYLGMFQCTHWSTCCDILRVPNHYRLLHPQYASYSIKGKIQRSA